MELISTRLIYHKYTQDYLESRCAIDTLKDTNLEWKSFPFFKKSAKIIISLFIQNILIYFDMFA